jgi:hypothetical protein
MSRIINIRYICWYYPKHKRYERNCQLATFSRRYLASLIDKLCSFICSNGGGMERFSLFGGSFSSDFRDNSSPQDDYEEDVQWSFSQDPAFVSRCVLHALR